MRRVVVYSLVSLDGVAESPDRFFDWDEALDAQLAELISTQDAVLLGRRSYDEWGPYWPTSDIQPFADFINGVTKHVVTSTPLEPTWSGASAVEGDPVAFARSLKEADGGDIGVHASTTLARALLAGGVVDVLRQVVAPAVAGSGRRLLDGVPARRLELLSSQASPTGHLVLDHRVLP